MEPVECYAAKKLIDLFSRISDGESLADLRNLAVALAAVYGIDLSQAPSIPKPYPHLILNTEHLPPEDDDEEEHEKAWERYREGFKLAVAVLKVLSEKCRSAQSL